MLSVVDRVVWSIVLYTCSEAIAPPLRRNLYETNHAASAAQLGMNTSMTREDQEAILSKLETELPMLIAKMTRQPRPKRERQNEDAIADRPEFKERKYFAWVKPWEVVVRHLWKVTSNDEIGRLDAYNETQVDAKSKRWSTSNLMVLLPMACMALPLSVIWFKLEQVPDEDEVWTAVDTDLRSVDISSMGASGVSLLRMKSDRVFAIQLSFLGFMLQVVFLYFMFLDFLEGGEQGSKHGAPIILLWSSLFFANVNSCQFFIKGMKALRTATPKGYEYIHQFLVILDCYIMPLLTILIGNLWLCLSSDINHLVFNATGLTWVSLINNQIAGLMSWSLAAHSGRAFVPTQVSIKDSVNSMRYTFVSVIFAAVLATFMVPVSIVVFDL